jgi:hypothetical protein
MSIPVAAGSAIICQQLSKTLDKIQGQFQALRPEIQALRNETLDNFQALRNETLDKFQGLRNETLDKFLALDKILDKNRDENQEGFQTLSQQVGTLSNTVGILVENQVRYCLTKRNFSESTVQSETLVSLRDLAKSVCRKETLGLDTCTSVPHQEFFTCGAAVTVEGSESEINNASSLLAVEAFLSVGSFAQAITDEESGAPSPTPTTADGWVDRLHICIAKREETVPRKDWSIDTRLKAFKHLSRFYSRNLSRKQLEDHPLGLMIYWWIHNDGGLDVMDEVEFDCRSKLVFSTDVLDERCVLIEVGEIKTSQSGTGKGKAQCICRLMLLSGAVKTVHQITKQRLRAKVFVGKPTSGLVKSEIIQKKGLNINIECVDSILTSNFNRD